MLDNEYFNRLYVNNMRDAITYLEGFANGTTYQGEVVDLGRRYAHATHEQNMGRMTFSDCSVETANIGSALMKIKNHLLQLQQQPAPSLPAAPTPAPAQNTLSNNNMTINTFNITAFIDILNNAGDDYNVGALVFPDQDDSLVLRFIDQIKANDNWNTLKRRRRYNVIYRYMKTLCALSADADLELEVTDKMDSLVKRLSLGRIQKPAFEQEMETLVAVADDHIARLERQEEEVANDINDESLADHHNRLRNLSAAATLHESWMELVNRLLSEIDTSSMKKAEKLSAKASVTKNILNSLQALSNRTGYNLHAAIMSGVSPRITKAIKSLDNVGSDFC